MKTPLGVGVEVDLGGSAQATLYQTGSQLSEKGAEQPPSFRPMSIVATVANLSYC